MAQLVQPTTKTLRLKKGVKFWPLTMILDISSHKSRIQHGNWWMCKKDQQRGERCWIFCQKQDPGEVNCFESCESGSVLPIISLPISSSTPSSALLTSIGQETHFHRDLRPFHCIFLTICLFWRENLPILCKGCPPPTNCYDSNDWIVLWSLLLNIAQNPSLRHRPVGSWRPSDTFRWLETIGPVHKFLLAATQLDKGCDNGITIAMNLIWIATWTLDPKKRFSHYPLVPLWGFGGSNWIDPPLILCVFGWEDASDV